MLTKNAGYIRTLFVYSICEFH